MATMLDAAINLKDNFSDTLKQVEKSIGGFSRTSKKMGRDIQNTGRDVEKMGSSLTKSLTLSILGIGAAALKSAIDSEDAFAGIRKTVDATEDEFKQIRKELDSMSLRIPIDKNELYEIGEAAGQLGIKKDDIVDFTETISELSVTTNLTSDAASSSLAKFANIMQMDMGNIDNLGSTIVDLGNNLATTEADIVAMSMRLAGAGKQIGLSEAEVLSFAGALSSVGIEAEAGGSAFSKVMINMQLAVEQGLEGYNTLEDTVKSAGFSMADVNQAMSSGGKELKQMAQAMGMDSKAFRSVVDEAVKAKGGLEDFATVAGMSGEEFTKAFQEDASSAITEFVKGIGDVERNGKSAIQVLDDMDIKEVRLRDTLLRAAGASDLFSEALGIGTKAWEENVALAKEADVRFGTTASKIQLVKNQFKLLGDVMGQVILPTFIKGIDKVTPFATKLLELDDATKENIVRQAAFVATIGPVLMIIGKITGRVGKLVSGFGKFAGVVKSVGLKGAILTPGVQVAAVIAALVVGAILLYKNWDKVKETFFKVKDAVFDFAGITSERIEYAKEVFNRFGEGVKEHLRKVKESLAPLGESARNAFSKIGEVIVALMPIIRPILAFIVGVFIVQIMYGFQATLRVVSAVIQAIAGHLDAMLAIFSGVIDFVMGVFTGDWDRAWEGIKAIFWGFIDMITNAWGLFVDLITTPVSSVIDMLDNAFHDKLGKVKEAWEGLKEFFKHPIQGTVNLAKKGAEWVGDKVGVGENYKGTNNWRGGATWVHEQGAEIIDLPKGSRVYPHDKSLEMARRQGMEQSRIKSNTPKVPDIIQTIQQKFVQQDIPNVSDSSYNVRANVKPMSLPKISDTIQTVKQRLKEVAIPKISDATQTIKQKISSAIIEPIKPIKRDVIQTSARSREDGPGKKDDRRKFGINIAKLADQIIVREESDIDKIADAIVRKIEKAEFNMA